MNLYIILIIMVMISAACNTENTAIETPLTYTEVQSAEINAGDDVPQPSGDVILTITGNINVTNIDDTLQFDMDSLEKLGLIEYSVNDKQAEGRVTTFQGVLLNKILEVADVDDTVTILHTIALNDYTVDIPIEDPLNYPVLIATQVEGEYMTVDRYGPIRIIYPYSSFDLDETIYDPRWNWQLKAIDVR